MILLENQRGKRLAFYDVPKNASTSIKKACLEAMGKGDEYAFFGEQFIEDGKRIDNSEASESYKKDKSDKRDYHDAWQNSPFNPVEADYRICIFRDPVDRFSSGYNHIVKRLRESDMSANEMVERMIHGMFHNNHFFPQTFFLGHDIHYYTHACDFKNLKDLEPTFSEFFGVDVKLPHLQTSGSEFDSEITEELRAKLRKIYNSDYKTFYND